jgi:hypothetical protein
MHYRFTTHASTATLAAPLPLAHATVIFSLFLLLASRNANVRSRAMALLLAALTSEVAMLVAQMLAGPGDPEGAHREAVASALAELQRTLPGCRSRSPHDLQRFIVRRVDAVLDGEPTERVIPVPVDRLEVPLLLPAPRADRTVLLNAILKRVCTHDRDMLTRMTLTGATFASAGRESGRTGPSFRHEFERARARCEQRALDVLEQQCVLTGHITAAMKDVRTAA